MGARARIQLSLIEPSKPNQNAIEFNGCPRDEYLNEYWGTGCIETWRREYNEGRSK